jgi:hypothetical protein
VLQGSCGWAIRDDQAKKRHLPRLTSRFELPAEFCPNWADQAGFDRVSGWVTLPRT